MFDRRCEVSLRDCSDVTCPHHSTFTTITCFDLSRRRILSDFSSLLFRDPLPRTR